MPDLENILLAVSRAAGISMADIRSSKRHRTIVAARQVYCWQARRTTPRSLKQIATAAGLTNHATVLHAVKKVNDMLSVSDKLTITLIEKIQQNPTKSNKIQQNENHL